MEITFQDLFNVLLGIVLTVGGFLVKEVWRTLKDIQKEVADNKLEAANQMHELETKVAEEYARTSELTPMFAKIFDKLDLVIVQLGGKADR